MSTTRPERPTDDRLSQRYGASAARRRRPLLIAGVVLAVVFGGWLAWTIWFHANPVVTSELETFEVVDTHTANAVVVTTLADDAVRPECTVRAFAEDHTTVGQKSFTPEPGRGRRQTVEIRTERRATSVESIGCTAQGQDRPR
ncbi:DUF4307 domain-containing protein [Nocardioides flavescens]|uniref:DUF4307 domain-containing protein n=1 Tax=Nocardioides flavescens TaxID=2691959 RepID=A0A6L7F394_9ACTN|nr:DUF4307 domain-containing protein [Nocardioides flavescens]